MTDDALVTVGRIGKAHGLNGGVFVEAWTDDPEDRFAVGTELSTEGGPSSVPPRLTVVDFRVQGPRWVLRFDGVEDRNAAEALRGTRLLLPASERALLEDPDDFYDSDLVGLQARTPAGVSLGEVSEVVHGPGGDYLVLRIEGREHLVPFVAALVPTVDVSAGLVVIDAPDGLFDL